MQATPLLHGDPVLGDAERARNVFLGGDPVGDRAADPGRRVAIEPPAVGGAAGIPGPLAEIGLLEVVEQRVRAEALETAVAQLVRPHPRHEVAEILDELAVLARIDASGADGLARDHGRRPRRLERLEAHPIEPGRAAPLAITDQEGRDPNAAVGGSLEHEHDLGPVGLAPMAGTGREDAPAPPALHLIGPGHRGFHRIKADRANPATEPVPSPRLESHLLTERRVREVRGRHAQRLLPLVDDPSIGLDGRLGSVGHHLPAVEERWRFEAGVPHRRDDPLARTRTQSYACDQDRQRHDSHGLASLLTR